MAKLGLFAALTAVIAGLGFATLSSGSAVAADACQHQKFKTDMVSGACTKGGQAEAKKVMTAFMKEKKVKSCNNCHVKLAPSYELKDDAFEQFAKLGGKVNEKWIEQPGAKGSAAPPAAPAPTK